MKKKIISVSSLVVASVMMFSSVLVYAAPTYVTVATPPTASTAGVCAASNFTSVPGIINWASCTLMSTVIPFLFSIAAAAFIWGVISYYLNPENEEKRKKGKTFIIGGLIALFVMTSMWGIIRIFSGTFGLNTVIPTLDVNN